jgi:DNA repair protein RecO (recombination protein O)
MEWSDRGIVLAARRHGERAMVVDILTQNHGRHGGLTRDSARLGGGLQSGSDVGVTWRARLADHLGNWTIDATKVRAAMLLDDPARLAGLSSACAVCLALLPEREPHPQVYAALGILLDSIVTDQHWAALYVRFELGLLGDLGFGLDLSRCAVTHGNDDLVWVSPKTGRAVSREAGLPYADRLLALPGFLTGRAGATAETKDLLDGLHLTGHFLERHMPPQAWTRVEDARGRLTMRLQAL